MTRAAILMSFIQIVGNSALASGLCRRYGVAQHQHQPVGCGVQYQPHLTGGGAVTGGAIGSQLRLMQLDQVLSLTTRAINRLIKTLCLAAGGIAVCDRQAKRRGGRFGSRFSVGQVQVHVTHLRAATA
jgi:hypothetical protein